LIETVKSNHMKQFSVGQKWIRSDPIYGTFFGQVIEILERGTFGTVIITDKHGNIVDTFIGSAAAFQARGEWQLMREQTG